jgi:hypothetical protein
VNDRFEPNNVLDVATLFEAGVITRGKLCAKDQDIYRIEGGAFESVTLWALFQHASGDIDMDLLDAEGKVVAQSKGATDDELIELLLPAGGTYFVRVTGKDVTDNAYDLVFFIEN